MDIQDNARTCPRSRELIIQRVKEQGQSVQEVAQSLGISERTVYKWLSRYQAQGVGPGFSWVDVLVTLGFFALFALPQALLDHRLWGK